MERFDSGIQDSWIAKMTEVIEKGGAGNICSLKNPKSAGVIVSRESWSHLTLVLPAI